MKYLSPPRWLTQLVHLGLRLVLAFGLSLIALPIMRVQAATVYIPNGDVVGLIAAINAANSDSAADTIHLAHNSMYILTSVDNDLEDNATGLPRITSDITIVAHGAIIERSTADGIPSFRIFSVAESGSLTPQGSHHSKWSTPGRLWWRYHQSR